MVPIVTQPETDEYGYAPTRIVRVRWSRHKAVAKFYRVWMKPGNLDFPEQERLLIGAEHIDALVKFLNRGRQPDEEIRLDAHPTPPAGGVYPESDAEAPGEVGASSAPAPDPEDSPLSFLLHLGEPTPTQAGVSPNFSPEAQGEVEPPCNSLN